MELSVTRRTLNEEQESYKKQLGELKNQLETGRKAVHRREVYRTKALVKV